MLRDKEEDKNTKDLKKTIEKSKERYNQVWEENEYLKAKIEKLGDELDRNRKEFDKNDQNRELLSDLYEKGIIDEEGKIIQYNEE